MFMCPQCEGKKTIKCPTCDGNGLKFFVPVLDIWESDCNECYGVGHVRCPVCEGVGQLSPLLPGTRTKTPTVFTSACD